MADERIVLSSRIDPGVNAKLLELVQHFQKESVGTVTKRVVLEKAINELYQRHIDNGLNENEQKSLEYGFMEIIDLFLTTDDVKRLDQYILLKEPFESRSDVIRRLIDDAYANYMREIGQF